LTSDAAGGTLAVVGGCERTVETGAKGGAMVGKIGLAVALVAIVVGFGALAWADEVNGGFAGRKEIVFTFDGWSLGAYGGGIGMRCFLKEDIAIRSGLSLSLDHNHDDDDNDILRRDEEWVPDHGYESQSDATAVGLSVIGEKYLAKFHDVVPYIGLGVSYAYASDEGHTDYNYYDDGDYDWYSGTMTDHSGSLIGLVGVQWRFRDNVSLGGEYGVKGSLRRHESNSSETEVYNGIMTLHRSHSKTTRSSLDFESGRLLLAVRF
jgi:hypothetical protein